MKRRTLVAVCVFATVAVWASDSPVSTTSEPGSPSESTAVTAAPGDIVILPCYSKDSVRPSRTRWLKDGSELGELRASEAVSGEGDGGQRRLVILEDGSLKFQTVAGGDEGVYLCEATLPGSMTWRARVVLQVANVPARHPECSWHLEADSAEMRFSCSWPGCYPDPMLIWSQVQDANHESGGFVLASEVASVLQVSLNRSLLAKGHTLRCVAQHLKLTTGQKRTCSLTLAMPHPEVSPLVWAQKGSNVTLVCTEASSAPPANTTWSRAPRGAPLAPGAKYALSQDGAAYSLTIVNVGWDDEGDYFCQSENPLALRQTEVYLSIRASTDYTGAIVGVFIATLIVGLSAVVAKLLFANRHRICLGGPFGPLESDRSDVLSLVDSDEEQIFQAAPRLPPIADARPTAMVQIHRLPSGEQEDAGNQSAREEPQQLVTL
ncbi:V-set and immunoglobulin domain-containing protein 10 [Corythoichthys intestinalis]|uniref:V-set and immunoglobulin domain-containing protein 10 n=1 Tax=Corythoichthys intestinalis TaxID=161448 RepID=UPI0025A5DA69|nr:V-set and immunoglobulin domain-containing protein 10 [Corythoichthys intestinalis]